MKCACLIKKLCRFDFKRKTLGLNSMKIKDFFQTKYWWHKPCWRYRRGWWKTPDSKWKQLYPSYWKPNKILQESFWRKSCSSKWCFCWNQIWRGLWKIFHVHTSFSLWTAFTLYRYHLFNHCLPYNVLIKNSLMLEGGCDYQAVIRQ